MWGLGDQSARVGGFEGLRAREQSGFACDIALSFDKRGWSGRGPPDADPATIPPCTPIVYHNRPVRKSPCPARRTVGKVIDTTSPDRSAAPLPRRTGSRPSQFLIRNS